MAVRAKRVCNRTDATDPLLASAISMGDEENKDENVEKSMADLTIRLPFMDLSEVCKEQGFAYAAVWFPFLSKHDAQRKKTANGSKPINCLRIDEHASHDIPEAFKTMEITELGMTTAKDGELIKGVTLPFKAFTSENDNKVEFFSDMQAMDVRKAHLTGIPSGLAIFRDGATYEFGYKAKAEAHSEAFVSGIGGSTGVAKAPQPLRGVSAMCLGEGDSPST